MPFALFSERIAFILFFLLQTMLLIRTFYVIERMLPINTLAPRQRFIWLLFSVACSLRFILHNVEFGQVIILILFLTIEGLYQIFYRNKLLGSLLLGLGIHIKLLPFVFIPYLLWRKELRWAGLSIICFVGLWFTPLAFGNMVFVKQLFYHWCQGVNPFSDRLMQNQEKIVFQIQGLQPLLASYLLDSKFEGLGFDANIATLSPPAFSALLQLSRLLFVLFTLFFLRRSFFLQYPKGSIGFWQLSYLFLAITIIFPQQQKYSLLLMTPFFCYIIWWLITQRSNSYQPWKRILVGFIFLVLLTTFTSDLFVGMHLNYALQCLRILSMANILAVLLLACAKPANNPTSIQMT